jgi:hypothetical protein
VPTLAVEEGRLKGTQARDRTIPAADGKPAVTAHAAVHGLNIATRDRVDEVKIRFEGARMMDFEFDDRAYADARYGHPCRAQVCPAGLAIIDARDGGMRDDIYAMRKEASRKAGVARLLAGRSVTYPLTARLEAGRRYTLVVETVGDAMRVTLDSQPAAYLESSRIGHATKSKIALGVAGKDGSYETSRSGTTRRPGRSDPTRRILGVLPPRQGRGVKRPFRPRRAFDTEAERMKRPAGRTVAGRRPSATRCRSSAPGRARLAGNRPSAPSHRSNAEGREGCQSADGKREGRTGPGPVRGHDSSPGKIGTPP